MKSGATRASAASTCLARSMPGQHERRRHAGRLAPRMSVSSRSPTTSGAGAEAGRAASKIGARACRRRREAPDRGVDGRDERAVARRDAAGTRDRPVGVGRDPRDAARLRPPGALSANAASASSRQPTSGANPCMTAAGASSADRVTRNPRSRPRTRDPRRRRRGRARPADELGEQAHRRLRRGDDVVRRDVEPEFGEVGRDRCIGARRVVGDVADAVEAARGSGSRPRAGWQPPGVHDAVEVGEAERRRRRAACRVSPRAEQPHRACAPLLVGVQRVALGEDRGDVVLEHRSRIVVELGPGASTCRGRAWPARLQALRRRHPLLSRRLDGLWLVLLDLDLDDLLDLGLSRGAERASARSERAATLGLLERPSSSSTSAYASKSAGLTRRRGRDRAAGSRSSARASSGCSRSRRAPTSRSRGRPAPPREGQRG